MSQKVQILNAASIHRILSRIAHEIAEKNENCKNDVVLLGIPRGGVHLARRLGKMLEEIWGKSVGVGMLDVNMHRDDLDNRSMPEVYPTEVPFDITGKTVVLVDDVLFSGRTTRAALDAMNDFGRPQRVQLAVLVDRGHRELPIKADFIGKDMPTSIMETVQLSLSEMGGEDLVVLEKKSA